MPAYSPADSGAVEEDPSSEVPVSGHSGDGAHRKPVTVRGLVRRRGIPVVDYDLDFFPTHPTPGARTELWEYTGAHGEFELDLPPGTYHVRNGQYGPTVAELTVPTNVTALSVDLHLPFR